MYRGGHAMRRSILSRSRTIARTASCFQAAVQETHRSFGSCQRLFRADDWKIRDVGPASGLHCLPSLRKCVVTGGSSGIGFEVCKRLVLDGASAVIIVSRSATRAEEAISRVKQETGCDDAAVGFVECDFQDLTGLLKGWKAPSGDSDLNQPFDTLINCAGITQAQGLLSTSSDAVAEILKVNLQAPMDLSRQMLKDYFALARELSKQPEEMQRKVRSFCVVNVSSLLANRGGYGTSAYSASKAGLLAFTRTLALEGAAIRERSPILPPFRANVVVPGYVDTPMIGSFSASHTEKLTAEIPLGRYGSAAEVADAIMFLVKNEYANNTVLNLDGGLSAR